MRSYFRKGLVALAALAVIVAFVALQAEAPATAGGGKVKVTWLGHAAFQVTSPGGTTLLLDPFLVKNPKTPAGLKDLSQYKPDAILVTHSHGDHVGDTIAIAKASGAKVVGASDHVRPFDLPKAQKVRTNVGGKVKIGDVTIHVVPAMHGSSPGGRPVGYVLEFTNGTKIYDTGDTWIFGDMALIQEIYAPTVILLQAGGGPFNQDPKTAALAIKKFFKPAAIIPMHYATWGILASEADVKAALGGDSRVKMIKPGDSLEF